MENNKKINAGVVTGTSLAILGTTCCTIPAILVTLGMGGAVASLASNVPWLITLSKYKVITFSVTGLVLAYCWWQIKRVSSCSIADAKRLKWQRVMLWISTILLVGSLFAAYALLPIMMWLDQ